MYVFVRKDQTGPQIAVQAIHAAIEIARKCHIQGIPSVILCGVKNERSLERELTFFRSHGILCEAFFEPDIGNEMTAFATEPVASAQRELFRRGQLCKVSDFYPSTIS